MTETVHSDYEVSSEGAVRHSRHRGEDQIVDEGEGADAQWPGRVLGRMMAWRQGIGLVRHGFTSPSRRVPASRTQSSRICGGSRSNQGA